MVFTERSQQNPVGFAAAVFCYDDRLHLSLSIPPGSPKKGLGTGFFFSKAEVASNSVMTACRRWASCDPQTTSSRHLLLDSPQAKSGMYR